MSNDILNKIDENRDAFDNDKPDGFVWENIHKELHSEKKKRAFIWLKIAAVFAVIFTGVWYFTWKKSDNDSLAMSEPPIDPEQKEVRDSISGRSMIPVGRKVIRGGDWGNANSYLQKGFHAYRGNVFKTQEYQDQTKSYIGFRDANSLLDKNRKIISTYLDQTEITNNEYRDFVNYTREFEHDLNPDAKYNAEDGQQQKLEICAGYTVTVVDANNCVSSEVYSEQLSAGFYYEQYDAFEENKFLKSVSESISTFGIDVDAAGYSNMRRFIEDGFLPPKDAVKIEEMVNYFNYSLPEPSDDKPFSFTTELGKCPWNPKHELLQICIKGKTIQQENLPASNLVFLIDVSGSMQDANKLELLKKGFKMLVNELREEDKVSIVVYAGAAGVVLKPTSGLYKNDIIESLESLTAGGSTAGGEGINLAYSLAEKNFIINGNNRIILATDGDFNVGLSDDDALIKLVEEKRKSGVNISVLAFGEGNLQSSKMEKIADNGNGNYSYIDNVLEAKKVLVTQMGGTLHTIAKDVKLQLEFNPKVVESYRLLGYENRMLATEDFENDLKDAGDLGSGHTIVAMYEIIPAEGAEEASTESKNPFLNDIVESGKEMATLKFRYKEPDGTKSKLLKVTVKNNLKKETSMNFGFSSAVAEFGLLIRDSEYKGKADFDKLIERARENKGKDLNGYRAEFIQLAEKGEMIFEEYHSKKE